MKETTQKESLPDGGENLSTPTEPQTTYRWRYADQMAHDAEVMRKKNRRGILIYALVLAAAFLISFGILIAVLLLGGGAA